MLKQTKVLISIFWCVSLALVATSQDNEAKHKCGFNWSRLTGSFQCDDRSGVKRTCYNCDITGSANDRALSSYTYNSKTNDWTYTMWGNGRTGTARYDQMTFPTCWGCTPK